MNSAPSFVFFGTPRFAALALDEFAAAGLLPELIVTAPDKPAGRGLSPTPPAVKSWAVEHNIPFIQPATLKEIPAELTAKKYDAFVVAAYGKILRPQVLSLPIHGCVNLHPSLLPKFRGASPIESQILTDEPPVGVSVMQMDEETDHGPIYEQKIVEISDWPIGKYALTDLFAKECGLLAAAALPRMVSGDLRATPQNHELATVTEKILKEDGELEMLDGPDGTALPSPSRGNYLKYLAYEGWPGTYFFVRKNGKQLRVKVARARLENGDFIIERVIPEGKSEQSFEDFRKMLQKA